MTIPSEQKAAAVPEQKAASIVQSRSVPVPKQGEVKVKITATAINPVDAKIRDYKFVILGYPAILGSDGAGVIVALGDESLPSFKVGDRVFFQGNSVIKRVNYSMFAEIIGVERSSRVLLT